MKRVLTVAALAAFAVSLTFADDAKVLPEKVLRARVILGMQSSDKVFDNDGKEVDSPQTVSSTAVGSALEYGVTDQITAGFQWTPGYILSTKFDSDLVDMSKFSVTGPSDIEIGAKFLLVGEKGFVENSMFRVAVTPGISVPLDKYDPDQAFEDAVAGDTFKYMSASQHQSLGFGLKADVDYIVVENFFINAHLKATQFLPFKGHAFGQAEDYTTKYGLDYILELEPNYTLPLGGDMSLSFGLPITQASHLAGSSDISGEDVAEEDIDSVTSVSPRAAFFFLAGPLPLELEGQYMLDVAGKNFAAKTSTIVFQVKTYLKF